MVSKEDNGIQITICKDGIHSLSYNWGNIVPMISAQKPISKEAVIEKYSTMVRQQKIIQKDNVNYRQVYIHSDNKVIPAWVFGSEDAFLNPIYIHAITGERLQVG